MQSPSSTAPPIASRRLLAVLIALATALSMLAALGTAPASAQAADCVTAFPTDDIATGMTATGLTVERGTTPDEFDATVLGVLENGIATGIDMIVAELDSPAIERAGVWSGMSGSPVYTDDGELLGAVAYGFSWAPSPIAGLVPAESILQLYDYPRALDGMVEQIRVPASMLAGADLGEGAPAQALSGQRGATMRQLQLPVAVSGVRDDRMDNLHNRLKLDDRTTMMRSGSSSADDASDEIVPGSNFAAALSYGDFTVAGVGTTTDVCNGQSLAFGHPFYWSGETTMSVHAADALLVEVDQTSGSFKMANIGGLAGTLDQDRYTGIRGQLGEMPPTTDFTTSVTSTTLNRSGDSQTWIVDDEIVRNLSAFAMMSHMDVVADRYGPGHMWYEWTVSGTTADGSPFTVSRDNHVGSAWDVSYSTLFDYSDWIRKLERNPHSELSLDEISVRARMSAVDQRRAVSRVKVAINDGRLRNIDSINRLRLHVGDELRVVVVTEQLVGEAQPRRTEFDLVVPRRMAGKDGFLTASGGRTEARASRLDTGDDLPEMLDNIEAHPRSSDLTVQLLQRNGRRLDVSREQTVETSRATSRSRGVGVIVQPV